MSDTAAQILWKDAEDLLANQSATPDAAALSALAELAVGHPAFGRDGSGEVAAELLLLIEQMQAGAQADRSAITVFLQAWRLLDAGQVERQAQQALMQGLKALRARYARPIAAA